MNGGLSVQKMWFRVRVKNFGLVLGLRLVVEYYENDNCRQTDALTLHCKNIRISTDIKVASFPYFKGTGSVTFVSVNRRNEETRVHTAV